MKDNDTTSIADELMQSFRRVCGDLLEKAHIRVLNKGDYDSSWDEDEFTRHLIKEMVEARRNEFSFPLSIHWDEKGKTEKNLELYEDPKYAQRVDITVDLVRNRDTIEYWIECKRVSSDDSQLVRRYWKKGVKRFLAGEYADKYTFGAMAGFVIEGELERNAEVLADKGEELPSIDIKEDWEVTGVRRYMRLCHTEHGRDSCPDIELDHYLLDFT